ncbi:MAG: 3-methyl-2-oxobutanoate hydroxymethyltransferase [Bdellovibrionales bacterium]|nr:3-methyl-2-oxobutanoate hydroxymethyltransferase [Bdellovibrionales bacterium]
MTRSVRTTIPDLQDKKRKGEKLSMLTCYDAAFARVMADTPVDILLVGDSVAMAVHGAESTLAADMDLMELHVRSVARGAPMKHIVGDLPFLSYRKGLPEGVAAAERLMRAGAHSVKLEGAEGNLDLVKHLVQSGVPVMGHLGLTPQSVHQLGGYRVQGRDARAADLLRSHAKALEDAGAWALVLECVPSKLSAEITASLQIPVIGIGAGAGVDGQVLVMHDMLGIQPSFQPKFLRRYLHGYEQIRSAFEAFDRDVKSGVFPSEEESYQ